jgi:hypothetical protein
LQGTLVMLGGSAAALLGALYGLGAAVEWRRLTSAGVRLADGLPLVPLPHILTAGIGVVLSTVIAFVGVTVFLIGLHALERLIKSKRINRHLKGRSRAVKTAAVSVKYQVRIESEEAQRLASVRSQVAEFEAIQVTTPKTDVERAALIAYKKEIETLLKEAQKHEADRLAMLERLPRLQRRAQRIAKQFHAEVRLYHWIVPALRYGPLVLGVLVGGFLVPYPIGIGLVVAGLGWLTGTKTKMTEGALRIALYISVGAGVIANGIISAPSLPIAHITTQDQRLTGPLIALTDTTWYIAGSHGVIRPIPVSHVQSGFTAPGATHSAQTFLQLIESL